MNHPGFELTAVVDPDSARRDEAATVSSAVAYTSVEGALAEQDLDLIVIASPTIFHVEHSLRAFDAGVDVFCDKPLAPDLAGARKIAEAAIRADRKIMVYQPHRIRPETLIARDVISRGLLGHVFMIKRASSRYDARNDWQAFVRNGGGSLNNYGAHFIDQLLYLSDSPPQSIFCFLDRILALGDAEDFVKLIIRTENDAILDIDINMAAAIRVDPMFIMGDKGSMRLDEDMDAWQIKYHRDDPWDGVGTNEELAAPDRRYGTGKHVEWIDETISFSEAKTIDYYQKCYEYFAKGSQPFVPISETLRAMEVIDTCRQQQPPSSTEAGATSKHR